MRVEVGGSRTAAPVEHRRTAAPGPQRGAAQHRPAHLRVVHPGPVARLVGLARGVKGPVQGHRQRAAHCGEVDMAREEAGGASQQAQAVRRPGKRARPALHSLPPLPPNAARSPPTRVPPVGREHGVLARVLREGRARAHTCGSGSSACAHQRSRCADQVAASLASTGTLGWHAARAAPAAHCAPHPQGHGLARAALGAHDERALEALGPVVAHVAVPQVGACGSRSREAGGGRSGTVGSAGQCRRWVPVCARWCCRGGEAQGVGIGCRRRMAWRVSTTWREGRERRGAHPSNPHSVAIADAPGISLTMKREVKQVPGVTGHCVT